MSALSELQHHFYNFIFHQEENLLLPLERLQIYRNNIFLTLTEALQRIYPLIQQLVGTEFFSGMAHYYIIAHPSTSPLMQEFGSKFSEFISHFPPAQTLPYLAEVAQFEWAMHEIYYVRGADMLDIQCLNTIPAEQYGNLIFSLHPTCRLFSFQYPIFHIWQLCQNPDHDQVDLAEGGEKLILMHTQHETSVEKLSDAQFALLSAMNTGTRFAEACALAIQHDPTFNISLCLYEQLQKGTVVNFSIAAT